MLVWVLEAQTIAVNFTKLLTWMNVYWFELKISFIHKNRDGWILGDVWRFFSWAFSF